jgi:dTDP-4-dehydrorhamnose 3,5-epimerase (EC 5.1.3.13)
MGKFKRIETALEGVVILEPTVFEDHRGFFHGKLQQKRL